MNENTLVHVLVAIKVRGTGKKKEKNLKTAMRRIRAMKIVGTESGRLVVHPKHWMHSIAHLDKSVTVNSPFDFLVSFSAKGGKYRDTSLKAFSIPEIHRAELYEYK